jgi:chromosomal replication initiation ATPase DnaA
MTAEQLSAWANVPLPLAQLVADAAEQNDIPLETLRSEAQRKELVEIRAAVAKAARQFRSSGPMVPRFTYAQIGRALNRDHTTRMWACGALKHKKQPPYGKYAR